MLANICSFFVFRFRFRPWQSVTDDVKVHSLVWYNFKRSMVVRLATRKQSLPLLRLFRQFYRFLSLHLADFVERQIRRNLELRVPVHLFKNQTKTSAYIIEV